MTDSHLAWAVLGTGAITRQAVPDLIASPGARVIAVGSRTREAAAAFAADFDIPRAYGSHREVYADPDVDAVYIGTPHGVHHQMAREALLAGKHVLCEKTFTTTADQARELADLARERGLFLMEAMWMKFHPIIQELRARVAAGDVGDVRHVTAAFGAHVPETPGSRFWEPSLGPGALLDLGVYPLTFAHMLLGRPVDVHASGTVSDNRAVDITAAIELVYESGARAHLATSIDGFLEPVATVGGTAGLITTGFFFFRPDGFTVRRQPEFAAEWVELPYEGYRPMFTAVTDAIGAGLKEHPIHPLADTIEVLQLIDTVRAQLGAVPASELA